MPVADTADASIEDFDRLMAINLRGTWPCMKHELRRMRKQGGPAAIVNCSSQNGLTRAPGLGAYVSSKHVVIGMTRAAALEYARKDICINVIYPGAIDTPIQGDGRQLQGDAGCDRRYSARRNVLMSSPQEMHARTDGTGVPGG
jgi:NAD(P)-dependent dehydrogenase (short-subunit alcohol dehydrogenase family)